MKNTFLLFIGILFFGQLWGQESKFEFGVSATPEYYVYLLDGRNLTGDFSNRFGEGKIGFSFGLKGRYYLNEKMSLNLGGYYQKRAYEFKSMDLIFGTTILMGLPPSNVNDKVVLNTIHIPINFELWFSGGWNAFAGISLNPVIKKERIRGVVTPSADPVLLTTSRKTDTSFLGLSFGVGKTINWNKSALQISPSFKYSFDEIEIPVVQKTNFQFSTGIDFTFWFK